MRRHPYRDAPRAPAPSRWRALGWTIPLLGIPLATLLGVYVLSLRTPRSARAQPPLSEDHPPSPPAPLPEPLVKEPPWPPANPANPTEPEKPVEKERADGSHGGKRGDCPSWKGRYHEAMREKDYECVRAMLRPRLEGHSITAGEARYLKAACAALDDVRCKKRATEEIR